MDGPHFRWDITKINRQSNNLNSFNYLVFLVANLSVGSQIDWSLSQCEIIEVDQINHTVMKITFKWIILRNFLNYYDGIFEFYSCFASQVNLSSLNHRRRKESKQWRCLFQYMNERTPKNNIFYFS